MGSPAMIMTVVENAAPICLAPLNILAKANLLFHFRRDLRTQPTLKLILKFSPKTTTIG